MVVPARGGVHRRVCEGENAGSTWMEIKVEILDCENCHSREHVQSLFA